MKKLVIFLTIATSVNSANALSIGKYMGYTHTRAENAAYSARHESRQAKNIAVFAVAVAVVSVFVAVKASEHNHGHIQLAKF